MPLGECRLQPLTGIAFAAIVEGVNWFRICLAQPRDMRSRGSANSVRETGSLMRISIVLPNLNCKKYLKECIEAFEAQDYENKRLIIVDSASSDGSHDIIRSFSERNSDILWIQEADRGISDALNIGLKHIGDGEIFGYLGADDIILPGTLRNVFRALDERPLAIGVFFDSYSQNAMGQRKLRLCPCKAMTLPLLMKHRTIAGMQNTYIRSDIVKRYGFNLSARYSMDYELYLRLAKDELGERIFHIATPSTVNINDGNISTRFRKLSRREAYRFAFRIAPFGWKKIMVGLRSLR